MSLSAAQRTALRTQAASSAWLLVDRLPRPYNAYAMAEPVDQLLPSSGIGFIARKSEATRYGTKFTIDFIKRLGVEWAAVRPQGPRLQIGDLSPRGGGPCPNGRKDAHGQPLFHKSHAGGMDFDVQIIRADCQETYRTAQISDPTTHAGTQQLIDLIEKLAGDEHLVFIFTAAKKALKGKHVTLEKEHTYHLHVRLQ